MRSSTAIHALLLLIPLLGACAGARPDLAARMDLASRYAGRGAVFHDAPVAQPSVTASTAWAEGTLSTTAWADVAADDEFEDFGRTDEVDLSAEYARSFAPFSASLGLIHYLFPATGATDTTEFYGSLSIDELWVTPTWTAYWDVGQADGAYCAFGLSREVELLPDLTLGADLSLGWMSRGMARYYFGVKEQGLSDLTLSLALTYAIGERTNVVLGLNAARVLDRDYRDAVDLEHPVWAVIGFETGF